MALYPSTQLCCRLENKIFFPERQTHENWKSFELSSIPKELSNIMLKQLFSLLQESKLSNRGIFTSNDGQECQMIKKTSLKHKSGISYEQNSSSKSLI